MCVIVDGAATQKLDARRADGLLSDFTVVLVFDWDLFRFPERTLRFLVSSVRGTLGKGSSA